MLWDLAMGNLHNLLFDSELNNFQGSGDGKEALKLQVSSSWLKNPRVKGTPP